MKQAREWSGLTLRDAAEALLDYDIELTHGALGHYEHGRRRLYDDLLLALCVLYDASPLWVLTELGPERWSDMPGWLEEPEKAVLRAAVKRFALRVGSGEAATVAEEIAEYLAEGNGLQDEPSG